MSSRILVALRIAASPGQVFDAFTREIDQWWRPSALFAPNPGRTGRLAFEPGPAGRLVEAYDDGEVFEVGRVEAWEPPWRLVLSWRHAAFATDQETEVHVRFEPVGDETRVTVEHHGWDRIPGDHAARHGFPLFVFQQRLAEWWQAALRSLGAHLR